MEFKESFDRSCHTIKRNRKSCILHTEAERNFAAHFDLSVEIKDQTDRLKVLRDISKGCSKSEMRQAPVTVSDTRKVDLSIMSF